MITEKQLTVIIGAFLGVFVGITKNPEFVRKVTLQIAECDETWEEAHRQLRLVQTED